MGALETAQGKGGNLSNQTSCVVFVVAVWCVHKMQNYTYRSTRTPGFENARDPVAGG